MVILKQVLDTIEKNNLIEYGDGIVVGISGGYDSVCLLHILYHISDEFRLRLFPVHVNHMLRGSEALRDESFVEGLCLSLGLNPHIKRIDIAQKAKNDKVSIEEAGRNARYDEFRSVALENSASKIAVAHSRNDQAETILMRIFRGTGLEGLKGIEYKRDNIIRPLLDIDRLQIEDYVNGNDLKAVTDSSNMHTDYFRNRIRLNVLPEINSAAKMDVTENLLRLSKLVVTDEDFLRYNAEIAYKKVCKNKNSCIVELDLAELSEMHQAIMCRILRMAVSDSCGSMTGIGFVHIEKLIWLIRNGQTGSRIDIPHGITAIKSYTSIIIKKKKEESMQGFAYGLEIPGELELTDIKAVIKIQALSFPSNQGCLEFVNKNKGAYTQFFDFNRIEAAKNLDIMVRNRQNGDIFKPLNSNGTKKLKEYFIDNKIPREERNKFPLIAINKEIIWIIGNKTSDNYKVTDNTKSVLMIDFIKMK
ncbi:tRNA(Ile)-lysidine synthase [Ruminiclostridium sufflavum DSM 19573]|uniref:tRNA(Ile)-lysidine synthase n=1 Tax=Ruminiclostridium sufflavum DSM 19573 TaxID=1121337 RepID=A0A318XPJ4_9FIRM|nr:tRNA lysidine(34) synthetase TilS [Ruminiclostridium sufflavum]PYG89100.1 tRNA(Ile)-lysidine synthase [Ruminiclostridium sufflavum DSM 19573]